MNKIIWQIGSIVCSVIALVSLYRFYHEQNVFEGILALWFLGNVLLCEIHLVSIKK